MTYIPDLTQLLSSNAVLGGQKTPTFTGVGAGDKVCVALDTPLSPRHPQNPEVVVSEEHGVSMSVSQGRGAYVKRVYELTVSVKGVPVLATMWQPLDPRSTKSVSGLTKDVIPAKYQWESELCKLGLRLRRMERQMVKPTLLSEVPATALLRPIFIEGFPMEMGLRPTVIFGDGGCGKSYLTLYLTGLLAKKHGHKIGLLDWEDGSETASNRLYKLFGVNHKLPFHHFPMTKPLPDSIDAVKDWVNSLGITYIIVDSAAPACGKPNDADVATDFFGSLKSIGNPSTIIAHITKAGATRKEQPFGSIFWNNLPGNTWYAERKTDKLSLTHKKWNGPKYDPLAFSMTFSPERTVIEHETVAAKTQKDKVFAVVKAGPQTRAALKLLLPDIESNTVNKNIHRFIEDGVMQENDGLISIVSVPSLIGITI